MFKVDQLNPPPHPDTDKVMQVISPPIYEDVIHYILFRFVEICTATNNFRNERVHVLQFSFPSVVTERNLLTHVVTVRVTLQ